MTIIGASEGVLHCDLSIRRSSVQVQSVLVPRSEANSVVLVFSRSRRIKFIDRLVVMEFVQITLRHSNVPNVGDTVSAVS
jgi:hypothetical protein